MKKAFLLTLMMIMVLVLLSACGGATRPLSEGELAESIPDEIKGEMTVKTVTIDRRQTNEKEDTVYAIIEMEDDEICSTSYYVFTINYYDTGGWIIDEYDSYQSRTAYPLMPPSDEFAKDVFRYGYEDYNITLISTDTNNYKNGYCSYVFELENDRAFISYSGSIVVDCIFKENSGRWSSSIADNNISSNWKFDNIIGKWGLKYEEKVNGHPYDTNYEINITQVSDSTVSANGRLIMVGTGNFNQGEWYGTDETFSDDFSYTESDDEISFVTSSYSGHAVTRGFTVCFTPDDISINSNPMQRIGN